LHLLPLRQQRFQYTQIICLCKPGSSGHGCWWFS
jgi:hypothetical protein